MRFDELTFIPALTLLGIGAALITLGEILRRAT